MFNSHRPQRVAWAGRLRTSVALKAKVFLSVAPALLAWHLRLLHSVRLPFAPGLRGVGRFFRLFLPLVYRCYDPNIFATTTGSYSVTVNDGAGCIATSTAVNVVVNNFGVTGTIFSENVGLPTATTLISLYTGWRGYGIYSYTSVSRRLMSVPLLVRPVTQAPVVAATFSLQLQV